MKKRKLKCPECGFERELTYSSWYSAKKYGRVCYKCSNKKTANSIDRRGSKNPFYGKRHSKKTLEKLSKARSASATFKTKEFSEKMSKINGGSNNPMFGKTMEEVWIEKYGVELAKEKKENYSKKVSKRVSGSGNPMFGKPSPQGSGNGWKGWHKGFFFRSLRELSYIVNVLEKDGLSWESAEIAKYRIPYRDFQGNARSYFADFVVNGKTIIEIKPLKLHKSKSVLLKKEAAIKFCRKHGLLYELKDIEVLSLGDLSNLMKSGTVVFMDRYENRVKKLLKGKNDF